MIARYHSVHLSCTAGVITLARAGDGEADGAIGEGLLPFTIGEESPALYRKLDGAASVSSDVSVTEQ